MTYNSVLPINAPPGTTVNTLGNSTWSSANPYGTVGTDPYGQTPDYVTPEQWQQALDQKKQELQAASGFARLQLQAQIDNAQKGLDNSLRIAQLQAENSRYGVDQQRQTAIDQLKQNARQFEANHDLDVAKLTGTYNGAPTLEARGQQLTEAQLIAQQRSQPNRLFQTMDLEQTLDSIRNGRNPTSLARTGVAAVDGLSSDYRGNPYLSSGGGSGQSSASGYVPDNGSGQAAAPDPRIKAIKGVIDALPPSETEGLDPAGVAALNAAFAIYHSPNVAKPGSLERLNPTQQATLQSAGDRLQGVTGRSYDDLLSEYKRNGVGQGAAGSY